MANGSSRFRRWRRGGRRTLVGFLVFVFSVCVVATTVGTWTRRTLLDTDSFVRAVGPLPENQAVDAALATFVTHELFVAVDVEARVRDRLPDDLQFLALPVVDGVQEFFRERVEAFLRTSEFDRIWRSAVRSAHENAISVLRDESDAITTEDGEVVLDLVPIINDVLARIQSRAPDFVGDVELPDLDETKRRELRDKLEDALGVNLPEDFGTFTIFDEDKLTQAQDAVDFADRFVVALTIVTLLLGAGALALSVDRRRTVLQIGLGSAVGIALTFTLVRRVVGDLLEIVPEGEKRDAARAAARIVAQGLRDRAYYVLTVAILVAVVAYVAGPGRGAVAVRRAARAGYERTREGTRALPESEVGRWVHTNLDGLRIGGVALALVAFVAAELSWVGLFLVVGLLVAYEVGVTVLARRATATMN